MFRKTLSSLAILSGLSSAANAQCAGDGPILDVPTTIRLGETVTVHMSSDIPAVDYFQLFASTGSGPTDLGSYGIACVSFPAIVDQVFPVGEDGTATAEIEIACDPALVGLVVYTQFITCGAHGETTHNISNMIEVNVIDGVCEGDMLGFTQGGWGTVCSGGNPGCRRDAWFPTVYPNGVVIGDADGIDGDGCYALRFTSSAAVETFLPAGKTPSILKADATNPKSSAAGVFAGQLLAAKLNVDFDDAGAFDDDKARDDVKLGDLVFVGGVDADLLGWSVRDLIALADEAICGAFGKGGIDITGDGIADVTIADLSNALDVLNNEFDNGGQDRNLNIS